tara:strand:+ start:20 stop:919 length:900 start_codon:yes stop_codon:yes gene_type:complete
MTKNLPMSHVLDPARIAERYRREVREEIRLLDKPPKVILFLTTDNPDSTTYVQYTQHACEDVGIDYELRRVARLDLEEAILAANQDASIHGIFNYWPVFNNEQDGYLRNQVDFKKDIEGLCLYWTRKLYSNDRMAGDNKKAILPCTPLAVLKLLTEAGVYRTDIERPIEGKNICIFNRSEIVGRPLAMMLSNDGATVVSIDINGPLQFVDAKPAEIDISRAEALSQADIVITGVPSADFVKISNAEIKPDTICLNFSSRANFEANVATSERLFIPRVGPVTVAMCMRNSLRLYKNFHQS